MAIILPYFAEFGSFRGELRKCGWLAINRFSPEKCHKIHQLSTMDAVAELLVELNSHVKFHAKIYSHRWHINKSHSGHFYVHPVGLYELWNICQLTPLTFYSTTDSLSTAFQMPIVRCMYNRQLCAPCKLIYTDAISAVYTLCLKNVVSNFFSNFINC